MIPMHDAALCFLWHPIFHQCRRDLRFIAAQLATLQQHTAIVEFAVLVSLVEICDQGHVELEGFQLRRNYREAVLAGDKRQTSTVVPFHVELPSVIHEIHLALCTWGDGGVGVIHGIEPDAGTGRIVRLDKLYKFSVHFYRPPIFMPCSGGF